LSGFGVPDDDMPHNQPLTWNPVSWGSLPYDERDLEAVLSGKTDGIAIGLHPVAKGLAPLHAAPLPAELAGEDEARAAFRASMGVGADEPGAAGVTQLPHRHRRRRGSGSAGASRAGLRLGLGAGAGWGALKVTGAAAAAAAVLGFAVSGALSGTSAPHGKQSAIAVTTSKQGGSDPTQRVDGGAREASRPASKPTPRPGTTPTGGAVPQPTANGFRPGRRAPHAKAGPGAGLCKKYFSFSVAQATPKDWAAHEKQGWELVALAGGPWNIPAYCAPYVGAVSFPWSAMPTEAPTPHAGQGWPGTGSGSADSADTGQGGSANSGGQLDTGKHARGSSGTSRWQGRQN
jgi:hypothetical protein